MSNFIVLVKQVPDITQITDNAFNPETGTLVRSRLASVINELDTQALAVAEKMNKLSGGEGRIVALTMGPPMAEEVLRYGLSRCVDTAVLLTSRALGGADTIATANPLACAIRKIAETLFAGSNDYYIVSGMQSVDGDTAQVPAQIAEQLGIGCIAYITDVDFRDNRFEFSRIISGGSQIVRAKETPTVITVAKYEYPLFATFARTRNAKTAKVVQWSDEDVKAENIGVKGSKTRVIRVFPPGKTGRKCQRVADADELAKLLVESFTKANDQQSEAGQDENNYILPAKRKNLFDRTFEGTEKEYRDFEILSNALNAAGITDIDNIDEQTKEKILASAGEHFHGKALEDMLAGFKLIKPSYTGQVWVIAEHDDVTVHPATFELIGKARQLAESLEVKVGVAVIGNSVEKFGKNLIAAGADTMYAIENDVLEEFDPATYCKALAGTIEKYWPQIVLFAATPRGRVLAPMVSARLGCGLTADCTSLDIRDSSRRGEIAILFQTRPALGGNVMATICTKDSCCQMATARPGVMKKLPVDPTRRGNIIREKANVKKSDRTIEIIKTEHSTGTVNLDAEIIVSGGKGMQNRDNYEKQLATLTEAIRQKLNVSVERGASRAGVEQGFIDRIHQVGQTGTAVSPKLYIALGISGAIQHMIGIANSNTIIAVNNDPNAPIFKQCDYYIVGTIEEVVPRLALALKGNKQETIK